MKRFFTTLALLSLPLVAGGALVARPGDAIAAEKCQIAVKGASPTARACAKGGREEARKVMKDMVTAAKASGTKFSCDSCHQDIISYELKPNAVEDYKKLQAASGIK